jgi:uncharacterized membrane protein YjjP (DUF1212 family)
MQARQAAALARYLPRWQQKLLAAGLLAAGIALIILGGLVGTAPLAFVAIFLIMRIRERSRTRPNRNDVRPDHRGSPTAPTS